jgi:hypothetical protein
MARTAPAETHELRLQKRAEIAITLPELRAITLPEP